MILEMKQKLLNNPIQDSLPKDTGSGSKRKGTPGLPRDSTLNMPEYYRNQITENFNNIMSKIKTLPEKSSVYILIWCFVLFFTSVQFHVRAG